MEQGVVNTQPAREPFLDTPGTLLIEVLIQQRPFFITGQFRQEGRINSGIPGRLSADWLLNAGARRWLYLGAARLSGGREI